MHSQITIMQLSLKRLHGLLCRLRQELAILEQYNCTIKEQLEKGIIEAVDVSKPTPDKVQGALSTPPCCGIHRQNYYQTTCGIQCFGKSSGPSLNGDSTSTNSYLTRESCNNRSTMQKEYNTLPRTTQMSRMHRLHLGLLQPWVTKSTRS